MKNRSVKLLFVALCITGFLLLDLGTPAPGLSEEFRIGAVTANVNLRKAPSLQGDIVSGLLQGSLVKIYEEKDGWYRVSVRKYHQVFNGWVSIEYVESAAEETTATPPATEEPEADHLQSRPPAEEPVESATIAPPEKPLPKPVEKSTPPEEKVPAVLPEPEPDKPAAAKPPKTKIADTKTERPPRVEKTPVADAGAEPASDLHLLLPTALPVVAVIVLLIVAIVYWVKRISSSKAEKPDSPAERASVVWPPPAPEDSPAAENSPVAENSLALEENELIEEDLSVDFEFQMEPALEDRNSGDDGDSPREVVSVSDDDGDSPTKVVSVYDLVMEKINRMSDVELSELLDLVDEQLGENSRKDDRLTFYTTVDYVVEGQYYRDFIQDLSVSGVFIKSRQMFEPGQQIQMTFISPYLKKPFKITGEIVRILDTGIGVKFDKGSQVQAEAISALMDQIRMVEETG